MARTKRTHVWEKAVAALLETATVEQAAARAGVGLRTLKRYLADPDFLRLYREARRQIVEGAVTHLQQLCLQAVRALHRNLTCGHPAAEIRAAATVLDQGLRGVELLDLASQVEDLRRQLAEVVAHGNGRTPKAGGETNGRAAAAGPGRPVP
jgi:hypothetical protein